jgi:DegV family protein with EDD domain
MTVKIVTDSTSDLSPEIVDELGITVVPLHVSIGNITYRDGVDLTTQEFYHRLAENKILPTTSAPSPQSFIDVFDRLTNETDEILCLTISSKLSATYESASEAKRRWNGPARLEIIDSYSAIIGLGLITIAAAKAARSGQSLDEIMEMTRKNMKRVDFRMVFDTLEYLRKGGRIGAAQVLLGSMLKINPVITLKDGATEAVTKFRSRAKAMEYLVNFATNFPDVQEIAIEDATTPDDVESLMTHLSEALPGKTIHRMKVSPVIGTHVGPHVLGIGVLPGDTD